MPPKPDISVLMLAYNHEGYIAQAIQGILDQKTDLTYEIVIGEDRSTDNTREVIRAFEVQYPEKIRVIDYQTNQGMHRNFLNTLFSCSGKYICVCEGDDYWNNPNKLTLQFQFLESNPEYVLVCGNHRRFIQNTGKFEEGNPASEKDHDIPFGKLIRYNCITTATIMFRNVLQREDFTPDFFSIISCDWYMYMKLLNHGKIRYQNNVLAVYRINDGSINGRTNRLVIDQKEMKFIELVRGGKLIPLDHMRAEQLKASLVLKQYDIAQAHALNGNRATAFRLCTRTLLSNALSAERIARFFKTTLLISSPMLFQSLKMAKQRLKHSLS